MHRVSQSASQSGPPCNVSICYFILLAKLVFQCNPPWWLSYWVSRAKTVIFKVDDNIRAEFKGRQGADRERERRIIQKRRVYVFVGKVFFPLIFFLIFSLECEREPFSLSSIVAYFISPPFYPIFSPLFLGSSSSSREKEKKKLGRQMLVFKKSTQKLREKFVILRSSGRERFVSWVKSRRKKEVLQKREREETGWLTDWLTDCSPPGSFDKVSI